ncbi:hypothetical protein [Pontibacter mucosus]|uniref:hypothetical protein n=1 Tax=Pontibacter mucosus TaxID=1649266 RepID=UPI0014740C8F|nr:hypothetical protein [Pontibacter mucosus]
MLYVILPVSARPTGPKPNGAGVHSRYLLARQPLARFHTSPPKPAGEGEPQAKNF